MGVQQVAVRHVSGAVRQEGLSSAIFLKNTIICSVQKGLAHQGFAGRRGVVRSLRRRALPMTVRLAAVVEQKNLLLLLPGQRGLQEQGQVG